MTLMGRAGTLLGAAIAAVAVVAGACATTDPILPPGDSGSGGDASSTSSSKSTGTGTGKSSSAATSGSTSASSGGSSCGDGQVDAGEECDDGNVAAGDGCTACVVDCEAGASKYAVNHHCYRVFATAGDEATAEAACEAWGGAAGLGHLVSIGDASEQAFVAALVTQPAWMGCGDAATEGVYVWYDGTPFTYTHFAPNEPNDPGHVENCFYMQIAGGWDDHDCAAMQPTYLCERRAAGAPP
jgi:cysteine-rich repeat protein